MTWKIETTSKSCKFKKPFLGSFGTFHICSHEDYKGVYGECNRCDDDHENNCPLRVKEPMFSDRLRIAKAVDEWFERHPEAVRGDFNVITALSSMGNIMILPAPPKGEGE